MQLPARADSLHRMKSLLVIAGLLSLLSLLSPALSDPQFPFGPFGSHFGRSEYFAEKLDENWSILSRK